DLRPIRTAVDRLEIALPAEYEYDRAAGATPTELVEDIVLDRSRQIAQIKLARKQNRPFTLTLAGSYSVQVGQEEAALEIVRPLKWSAEHGVTSGRQSSPVLDRGCQVNVTLPEGVEFVRSGERRAESAEPERFGSRLFALPSPLRGREYSW